MNLTFYREYEAWMTRHMRQSAGERRRRLEERVEHERRDQEDAAETWFVRDGWWPV